MIAVRAPLACSAAPCSRTLKPGAYKRVPPRGPAVGYFLSCPACRFVGAFSIEELDPEERSDIVCPGRACLISIRGTPRCYSCGCRITIDGNEMVAIKEE